MNISVNKNSIIGDKNALSPGGIRIGLCAMTTRGLKKCHCKYIAELIHRTIQCAIQIQGDGCKLDIFKEKLKDNHHLTVINKEVLEFTNKFSYNYKL